MRVSDEPTQLFYDPFDSTIDTTNRWNAATTAGGGVAASVTGGVLTLGSGTTTNGYSYITSQPTFVPTIPAWICNSWAIQIEAGATAGTNAVRFWGNGLPIGTPTSTAPMGTGNAYGFELDIAGVLQAVVYSAGVRTAVASLAAFQPTDGAYHRYICFYRTDRIYWYIDGLGSTQLAATSSFQSPAVQTLPVMALSVAHSSAPAASRVITCTGLAVSDTGKNAVNVSDGNYPWRKLMVVPKGSQGSYGVATQDLKDSGRVVWSAATAIAGVTTVTTEALVTMVSQRDGTAAATATSQTVTAGKRLRLTSISAGIISTAAAVLSARISVRIGASGAATATSPIVHTLAIPSGAALAQAGGSMSMGFAEGIEISGAQQVGISQVAAAVTGTLWVTLGGYEY